MFISVLYPQLVHILNWSGSCSTESAWRRHPPSDLHWRKTGAGDRGQEEDVKMELSRVYVSETPSVWRQSEWCMRSLTRYLSEDTLTRMRSSPTLTFSPSDLCLEAGWMVHQHASPARKRETNSYLNFHIKIDWHVHFIFKNQKTRPPTTYHSLTVSVIPTMLIFFRQIMK